MKKKTPDSLYEKNYSLPANIAYYFRFYQKNAPRFLWFALMEIVFGAAVPFFGIYLPKLALDLVAERAPVGRVFLMLGGLGAAFLLVGMLSESAMAGKYFWYNTRRSLLAADLFLKSLRVPYQYVEGGEAKGLYWKAANALNVGDNSGMHRISYGTIDIVKQVLSFLLYSAVLGALSPGMVVFLVALSFAQYGLSLSKIKFLERFRKEDAELSKKSSYVFGSAMGDVKAAKDIRIFRMQKWLGAVADGVLEERRRLKIRKTNASEGYRQLGSLLALFRDVCAYVYLIGKAGTGAIGASDFVLYFGAVTGFSGFVGNIMNALGRMRVGCNSTNLYRAYMELPEEEREEGRRHIAELSMPPEIEFCDMSFAYEGAAGKVFDHFNLKIRAGEKIALVGVNGAGKTTLVKLLCGMYEPDEGQILINGIDRREFPRGEIYALFSVVFQEKFILPVRVGENLALDTAWDEKRAWAALEAAGLSETFRSRGISLKAYFGKNIDGKGVELSGGQEQRFLMARALYKDAPVLVLDEPTAALDPIAESETYDSYMQLSQNKTAVFISHRLASTRFSDRIVLLEGGRLMEEGTHEELMAQGGKYAEMFRVQSNYYSRQTLEKEAFS